MQRVTDRLYSWASEVDRETLEQARMLSRLPIIEGHVALMPDAHLGIGSAVGSVIPTKGAVIPAAIGVDIGCGMIASRTDLSATDLPDDLRRYVDRLARVVPAGLGNWHREPTREAREWMATHPNQGLTHTQATRAAAQLGSMGSGNHFFELCLDQHDDVWVIMHSGSRGVGNQLADHHMKVAKRLCDAAGIPLEHPDLAYLQERTPQFDAYIRDMRWSQAYALENRRLMMDAALKALRDVVGRGEEAFRVDTHHNFTALERHGDQDVWITRKGAVRAAVDDWGLVPGAMGQKSFVVRGLGNELAYRSCAHGAGRRLSRRRARKELSVESFAGVMAGRAWQEASALELLDEHPGAYKPIEQVMAQQSDLVRVEYELRGIANYKGTR